MLRYTMLMVESLAGCVASWRVSGVNRAHVLTYIWAHHLPVLLDVTQLNKMLISKALKLSSIIESPMSHRLRYTRIAEHKVGLQAGTHQQVEYYELSSLDRRND